MGCASGSLLTKVWKTFREFKELGILKELNTKVFAAQAMDLRRRRH